MTLGNDKTFHDRLSWLLTVPIAMLAAGAAYLAFLALEVAAEGDQAGSAAWWISPARFMACGFALARVAGSVAPVRKPAAAAVVGLGYALLATWAGPGAVAAGCAWGGAVAGVLAARALPDDDAKPASEKA